MTSSKLHAMIEEIRGRHRARTDPGGSGSCLCSRPWPCDASLLADKFEIAIEALERIHVPHFDGSFCRKQYEAGAKCCPACEAKMALSNLSGEESMMVREEK